MGVEIDIATPSAEVKYRCSYRPAARIRGVRLFGVLPDGIRLDKLSVSDGAFTTHMRYRVIRNQN
jgi:hypothetical protein